MDDKTRFWIVLSYTALALLFNYFFGLFSYTLDAVIFYLVIPVIIVSVLFKENLKKYGIAKGDVLEAVTITSLLVIVVVMISYWSVKNIPALRYL